MANEKKSSQLGMDFSTATHQLRKRIVLYLLRRLGEDMCFRCGKRIESIQDLSIEHKVAWLDNDPALFWDLDNIAFSHLRCNSQYGSFGREPANKKVGPAGTAWCSSCQRFRPTDEFCPDRTRRAGRQTHCRACYYRERQIRRRRNQLQFLSVGRTGLRESQRE